MNRPTVYSVSELAGALKMTLQSGYGRVRVRGEISNYRKYDSGHRYFSLKDQGAQLRAVMFRSWAEDLRFSPGDGIEVEIDGEISFYERRGDLQLIARRMVPSGLGALMRAFEELKRRLTAEGLFAPERKRPIPDYPQVIGIVTSPSGAAVRDLIHVLQRRWPMAGLVLEPVRVQGEGAAVEIAEGIRRMNRWGGADVLIVGRGGGSLEDLWAFNEEPVARAIVSSRTPVVSAVGHEIDVTIADLAADVRAATPSAAAELVAPDQDEVIRQFRAGHHRLHRRLDHLLQTHQRRLDQLVRAYGFRRPEEFLGRASRRAGDLALRLNQAVLDHLARARDRTRDAAAGLRAHHPRGLLAGAARELDSLRPRLLASAPRLIDRRRAGLDLFGRALAALDPTAVLGRGYCLARDPASGKILVNTKTLAPGSPLLVQFQEDRVRTRVESTEPGGPGELVPQEKGS